MRAPCTIPGCEKPRVARGWCGMHYARWKRLGDPMTVKTVMADRGEPMRWLLEVAATYTGDDCLIWPFCRDSRGYGKVRRGARVWVVSRLICEHVHGPSPSPEHEAAHSCGKGHEGCVTGGHLRWATSAENGADMVAHGTSTRGERNAQAVLTGPKVRQILALKNAKSRREIAAMFGVDVRHVGKIHRRESWSWLEAA